MATVLNAARIPGAAVAVLGSDRSAYAQGFGYRDRDRRQPLDPETIYPIASTTKAMNAALLGMLVEEGILDWDMPVQRYAPRFRLKDPVASARTTLRDLVTMITGLPRHDAVWEGNAISRAALMERLQYLDLSSDFRRRLQYCNLSVTASGHVAEIVSGRTWEELLTQKLFLPLSMHRTQCGLPDDANITLSYHENARREVILTRRRATEATGPSGGSVHSTVKDMLRWIAFNLDGGKADGRSLLREQALAYLHAPQVVIGDRALSKMPTDGAYAMGWLVDHYQGHQRISHGGYVHDLNSSVMLFPRLNIGLVCFVNFGCHALAPVINECVFCLLTGLDPLRSHESVLARYEASIARTQERYAAASRVTRTAPSHPVEAYAGRYNHPGYGDIDVVSDGRKLSLCWREVLLPLQHWHYDVWVAENHEMWTIHEPHVFDRGNRIVFDTASDGSIEALRVSLEPAVAPIRFIKERH